MKFTFFIYSDERLSKGLSEEESRQSLKAFRNYIEELKEAGVFCSYGSICE